MGWLERRPHDATAQFLEYARTGRLVDVARPEAHGPLIALVACAGLAVGLGAGLLGLAVVGTTGQVAALFGVALVVGGLCVLAPAVRLIREQVSTGPLLVRPGAVLPPDLVRKGNWIYRDGAWVRVEHVGRDGGGRVHALLGTGDVVELRTPVTIAGDHFRAVADPVESLRP